MTRGPSTSGCCSATCPSTSSGWGRRHWPGGWWSGSTRPVGARLWPATSVAPTARWSITDAEGAGLLDGLDLGVPAGLGLRVDDPAYVEQLAPTRRGSAGRRRRVRTVPLRRGPLPAAVHLGHHRSAQGGALHAGSVGLHRHVRSAGAYGFEPRRRGLLHHAALPRERADGPVGPVAGGRGHRGAGPSLQRLGLPVRRSPPPGHHLHLRRQGAGLRAGHPAAGRRRRPPPCGGGSAPRPPWPTKPRSNGASAAC